MGECPDVMIGTGIFDTRYKYLHSEYVATGKTGGGYYFFFISFFRLLKKLFLIILFILVISHFLCGIIFPLKIPPAVIVEL